MNENLYTEDVDLTSDRLNKEVKLNNYIIDFVHLNNLVVL